LDELLDGNRTGYLVKDEIPVFEVLRYRLVGVSTVVHAWACVFCEGPYMCVCVCVYVYIYISRPWIHSPSTDKKKTTFFFKGY
jgi:hypothetical protein